MNTASVKNVPLWSLVRLLYWTCVFFGNRTAVASGGAVADVAGGASEDDSLEIAPVATKTEATKLLYILASTLFY